MHPSLSLAYCVPHHLYPRVEEESQVPGQNVLPAFLVECSAHVFAPPVLRSRQCLRLRC